VLALQERSTACEDDPVSPEPDSATEVVVVPATTEIAPEALPVAAGLNTTVTESDWPGSSVSPDSPPIMLNPDPVIVPRVVVRAEFPVLETLRVSEPLCPTNTSPKFMAVGLTCNLPVAVTPSPDNETVRGTVLPDALKSIDAEPVTAPVLAGLKATLNVELFPAPICAASARPDMLNPVPETDSDETETVVVPWFVTVKVCELLLPTGTLPRLALVGTTEIEGPLPLATPFAESVTSRAVLKPLPCSRIFPVCEPAAFGVNLTVNVALTPAFRLNGAVMPLIAK
jgi:hypothetical protein